MSKAEIAPPFQTSPSESSRPRATTREVLEAAFAALKQPLPVDVWSNDLDGFSSASSNYMSRVTSYTFDRVMAEIPSPPITSDVQSCSGTGCKHFGTPCSAGSRRSIDKGSEARDSHVVRASTFGSVADGISAFDRTARGQTDDGSYELKLTATTLGSANATVADEELHTANATVADDKLHAAKRFCLAPACTNDISLSPHPESAQLAFPRRPDTASAPPLILADLSARKAVLDSH
jgi:hypothetical protein